MPKSPRYPIKRSDGSTVLCTVPEREPTYEACQDCGSNGHDTGSDTCDGGVYAEEKRLQKIAEEEI